jgi:hypothetical protein
MQRLDWSSMLTVFQAAQKLDGRPSPQCWVEIKALDLGQDEDRFVASVAAAKSRGWLQAEGQPPHSVAITPSGMHTLNRCLKLAASFGGAGERHSMLEPGA